MRPRQWLVLGATLLALSALEAFATRAGAGLGAGIGAVESGQPAGAPPERPLAGRQECPRGSLNAEGACVPVPQQR